MNKEKDILKELAIKKAISWQSNYIVLLKDIKLTLFPSHAWAVTIQNMGEKSNEEYIFNLGRLYGEKAYKILKTKLDELKFNVSEDYQTFLSFLEISGIGKVDIFNEKNKEIKISFLDQKTIDIGIKLFKKNSFIIIFYSGVITSIYNNYFKRTIKFIPFIEDNKCYFIGK